MPIEDFIRELADPAPVAAPRPARAARPAPPPMPAMSEEEDEPAEPMEQMGSIGQTIDSVLEAIEKAGPEIMRWAQEVSQMPAEMKALRAQLDRIEALLTPPEVP